MYALISSEVSTGQNVSRRLLYANPTVDTLTKAYEQCSSDFSGSNLVFEKMVEQFVVYGQLEEARAAYEERLLVPHKQLSQTFERYSQFISTYFADEYTAVLREQSHVVKRTETYQRYYEQFEYRLLHSPNDANVWCEYMRNIIEYGDTDHERGRFLSVFYRSLDHCLDTFWNKVFDTALTIARQINLNEHKKLSLALLWRKAFPLSFVPLRAVALHLNDEVALNSLRGLIQNRLNDTPECLYAVKALVSKQSIFFYGIEEKELVLWLDLQKYLSRYPQSFDFFRFCVTIAQKIESADTENLILNYFEQNKFAADIYNYTLRYFSELDDDLTFERILNHFEENCSRFDDPMAVFPLVENYYLSVSDRDSFSRNINMIELLRSKVSAINKQKEEELAVFEEKPEVKRRKEKAFVTESTHRNREQFTITLAGIEKGISEDEIREFFAGYGNPIAITIVGNPTPIAKVELSSEQEVLTCLARTNKPLAGHLVTIERTFGTILWLANYPPTYAQKEIESMVESKTGFQPLSVRFPAQIDTRERRFCYVELSTPKVASLARSKLDSIKIDGFSLKVEISNPALKRQRPITSPKFQVYVKNLNFLRTTKENLLAAFSRFGIIDTITMPLKQEHTGSLNNGYAFITFKAEEEARNAAKAKVINLDDRKVEIYALKPRETHIRDARTFDTSSSVTIANISSSVTSKRLSAYIEEKVGAVKRLSFNPADGKALVEFETVVDAGKAEFVLLNADIDGQSLSILPKQSFFQTEKTTAVPMMVSPLMMRRRPRK